MDHTKLQTKTILEIVFSHLERIIKEDKRSILYLLYYSMLEALLLTVIPLTTSFVVNSILAHAMISIYSLGAIVIVIFIMIVALQILKEAMIERFEQRIFIKNALHVAKLSLHHPQDKDPEEYDRYMNYFFDVLSVQKLFPVLLLNGSALFVKVIVSLILLLIFDWILFGLGLFFIYMFGILVLFLGRKGPKAAIERSDAKHDAIFYLQHIPIKKEKENHTDMMETLDRLLIRFVQTRQNLFHVVIKQLSLTFIIEGIILSTFFIVGSYMVYEGIMPVGEFIAAEIVIISVVGTLRTFMKQIDYIYDMIEGFYKIDKLSKHLGDAA